ncbi:hypothetical protein ALI22I_44590 [Saccharothrix sp. ALI-22-I]|uniref:effector-associated domain 2-containing protein n=1 Tax=Saccharothrix sp. ALI-22-I TaxID=1933778 RepID=UPI00097CBAF5|nr:hypothetical protein [Saccharothrix sp. ALI-22-I]ONI80407.1 hypothetical protein ALI22I_44590 [Saccharothrix sp. ALI-22-I]
MGADAVHRSFVVVDVESYGDLTRTTHQRLAARDGMYQVLMTAFADCDLPWDDKMVDDAGDSLIVVLPADVPKSRLADHLPTRAAAELRAHNAIHSHGARLRMRMALHFGEVAYDGRGGKSSAALIFACRIVDTAEAKRALKDSAATLVVIASDLFYDSVIRHDPASHPEAYRLVDADVKETRTEVWIRLVDHYPATAPVTARYPQPRPRHASTTAALGPIVEVLLRTPGFDTREGRDLVLRDLPFASSTARLSSDRADTVSIVRSCEHYPDGLESLVEAIRFYAAGTTAMAELDTLMAARLGDG